MDKTEGVQPATALVETFASASVTPTGYVNAAVPGLDRTTTLAGLHADAVALLSTLDSGSQDLIGKLEGIVSDMLRNAGRLKYEVELLAGDVESFQDTVERDVRPRVEGEIAVKSKPMERLEMLDLVRRRLLDVLDVFARAKALDADVRAAAPTPYEAEIRELLAAGDVAAAETRVEAWRALVEVWKNTHEYAAKQEHVERLRRLVEEHVFSTTAAAAATAPTTAAPATAAAATPPPPPAVPPPGDRQLSSAELFRQEARDGYYGFLDSLRKMRQ
ncbi:uncharacterized protein V1510DRAFT_380359 [Dipodascopsis tothii]|uniref:uncharacterized protein n=1 Tax=Dipodascopsis tothii TaxID=44089 RepID=UPI0034CD2A21